MGEVLHGHLVPFQLVMQVLNKKLQPMECHIPLSSPSIILGAQSFGYRQQAHTPPLHVVKRYNYGHTCEHEETNLRRDQSHGDTQ